MATYRRRPTTIEAIQWNGANLFEIMEFTKSTFSGGKRAVNFLYEKGEKANLWVDANKAWLEIEVGDWIAKDKHGCYPIKDDVFGENYEEVEPSEVQRAQNPGKEWIR